MTLRGCLSAWNDPILKCQLAVRIAKLERALFAVGDADLAWDDWLDNLAKVHTEVMALYEREDVDRALLDEQRAILRSLLEIARATQGEPGGTLRGPAHDRAYADPGRWRAHRRHLRHERSAASL
jgi:hypothetical protein